MAGFGELEALIMNAVWEAGKPVTVREILQSLPADRDPAYTTIQTITEILHRKGWLTRAKDGRAFRYTATCSRGEYTARLMDEALAQTPDRTAALVHFADRLGAEEAAELAAALRRAASSGSGTSR